MATPQICYAAVCVSSSPWQEREHSEEEEDAKRCTLQQAADKELVEPGSDGSDDEGAKAVGELALKDLQSKDEDALQMALEAISGCLCMHAREGGKVDEGGRAFTSSAAMPLLPK